MKQMQLLFSMPQGPELLIIGIIVLLMFGGRKIPELMKGVGQGINQFKKGMKGVEETKEFEQDTLKEK